MHMSFEHDVDVLLEGRRRMDPEQIMTDAGVEWARGAFCLDTTPNGLSDSFIRFRKSITGENDLRTLYHTSI